MTRLTAAELADLLKRNPDVHAPEADLLRAAYRLTEAAHPCPTEHDEQVALFAWAAAAQAQRPELAMLFAVPNGGFADLSPDSPLRQERKVTIRYGDGGSSAQLVRWVGNLADEFREEIRAAVPTQPIDLTGSAEAPLISQILAAAVAAQSDPEPDPEPEQPDAGDEDHSGTGTTIDDFLSGMEGDPE